MKTSADCVHYHSDFIGRWLDAQCAFYEMYQNEKSFREKVVLLPVADFGNTASVISAFSAIGVPVQGPIPHSGHHVSNQVVFPKQLEHFEVLDFFEDACVTNDFPSIGQSVGFTNVSHISCPHHCELCQAMDCLKPSNWQLSLRAEELYVEPEY